MGNRPVSTFGFCAVERFVGFRHFLECRMSWQAAATQRRPLSGQKFEYSCKPNSRHQQYHEVLELASVGATASDFIYAKPLPDDQEASTLLRRHTLLRVLCQMRVICWAVRDGKGLWACTRTKSTDEWLKKGLIASISPRLVAMGSGSLLYDCIPLGSPDVAPDR